MMEDNIQEHLVWQTAFHLIASLILIVPAIYIAGFLAIILDFIQEGYIGKTGDGIGFFMRGIQFFIAGFAALSLPSMLLKRSNIIIVCTIFGTIVVMFFGIGILIAVFHPSASEHGFYEWLGILASFVGLTASAFMSKEIQN